MLCSAIGAECESRGMTVVEFPQTDTRMVPASKLLYQAVIDRAVALQPVQGSNVANAVYEYVMERLRAYYLDSANSSANAKPITVRFDVVNIFDWMGRRKGRDFFPKEFTAVTLRTWRSSKPRTWSSSCGTAERSFTT